MALPRSALASLQSRGIRQLFGGQAAVIALALVASAGAGLLVEAARDGVGPLAAPEFSFITGLPVAVYPALLLGLVAAVLVRNHWWIGLALFFAWLPLEDLVRKFTNNDLRVYFVKDLLLMVALLGVAPRLRGCWRRPLGETWLPLMAVFGFALVMSIPSAAISPALPIIAIHTRFLFAGLFPVGVYLAQERARLETTLFWLSLLCASACALGVVQAIVGPTFLNPTVSTFQHLTVYKSVGAQLVLRPSGPFADVSRFASMTIVAVVLGLSSLRLSSTPFRRRLSAIATAVGLAGAFASGSRTALLITIPIVAFAGLFPAPGIARARSTVIATLAAVAVAIGLAGGGIGEKSATTAAFYAQTVNPESTAFELGPRGATYAKNVITGLRSSNFHGAGTGTETLGQQYVSDSFAGSRTESGWGSVGAEWGLFGLFVWVVWAFTWVRKATRAARDVTESPATKVRPLLALYVGAFLIVMFTLGVGFFENYIANVFFWLLSGVLFAQGTDGTHSPTAATQRDPAYASQKVKGLARN